MQASTSKTILTAPRMTRLLILAILAVLLVLIEARVVLVRDHVPAQYTKLNRANPERMHEFRIALKQRNLEILEVRNK